MHTKILFTLCFGFLSSIFMMFPLISKSNPTQLSFLMDNFEKKNNWKIQYSKYRSKTWKYQNSTFLPDSNWIKWIDLEKTGIEKKLISPKFYSQSFPNQYVLGIRGSWDKTFNNYVRIIPSTKRLSLEMVNIEDNISLAQTYKKDPMSAETFIVFPGKSRKLYAYFWGMGYPYSLEAIVQDYNGRYHTLPANRKLDFTGWKNLTFNIPETIPQRSKFTPSIRPLKFIEFKIYPGTKGPYTGFFTFIDILRAHVELNEYQLNKQYYYGRSLSSRKIWKSHENNSKNPEEQQINKQQS